MAPRARLSSAARESPKARARSPQLGAESGCGAVTACSSPTSIRLGCAGSPGPSAVQESNCWGGREESAQRLYSGILTIGPCPPSPGRSSTRAGPLERSAQACAALADPLEHATQARAGLAGPLERLARARRTHPGPHAAGGQRGPGYVGRRKAVSSRGAQGRRCSRAPARGASLWRWPSSSGSVRRAGRAYAASPRD